MEGNSIRPANRSETEQTERLSAGERLARLEHRFRRQQEFAALSSPLYARLWGLVADWLAPENREDPLSVWLLAAANFRRSFDVPLLLLAGLHRDILLGCPEMAALARYFPTAGGDLSPDASDLGVILREAVLAKQERLGHFLRTATVQTNESARGLCWLLPTLYTGWSRVHLVDLGASAGLNLVADLRRWQLIGEPGGTLLLDPGQGQAPQFTVFSEGSFLSPIQGALPMPLTRIGCDLAPISLVTREDEQTLAAFVWGDQVERLFLLREGIEAVRRVNRSTVPVQLVEADLSGDLAGFLAAQISPLIDAPVVLFTTYVTLYLSDRGASLQTDIGAWASTHPQPVLWLRWEPLPQGPEPPTLGWLAWSADLWQEGRHTRWQLAWVHPHGSRVQWLAGFGKWAGYWQGKQARMGV